MRAIISVHDKTGIVEFAKGLTARGAEIISTGGTARLLREAGVPVRDVSEVTGFPEILDGRVKTLHPKIHGGILARRDDPQHMEILAKHGIGLINLVCCNLYPLEEEIAKADATPASVAEQTDIGGVTLIRAAAKAGLWVVSDPADYGSVLEKLMDSDTAGLQQELIGKAWALTARYDLVSARYWSRSQ